MLVITTGITRLRPQMNSRIGIAFACTEPKLIFAAQQTADGEAEQLVGLGIDHQLECREPRPDPEGLH